MALFKRNKKSSQSSHNQKGNASPGNSGIRRLIFYNEPILDTLRTPKTPANKTGKIPRYNKIQLIT